MKKYIVGLDFGHGETAAWIVPLDEACANARHGDSLMLRPAANVAQRTLWSVVYRDGRGNYSLDDASGSVVSRFKKKVEDLDQQVKAAYTSYIKGIYRRLLDLNTDLQSDGQGNTNFYLCIACPTKWSQGDKDAYVNFFNEALEEFNIKVLWAINESDAAFFTHGSWANYADKCVLVIDYGSSTIDYTVINNGKKISKDEWSNAQLGASNIETALLEAYRRDSDYQVKYIATQAKLEKLGLGHISIASALDLELRKAKENSVINQVYPTVDLNYNSIRNTVFGRAPEFEAIKGTFKFDYTGNINTAAGTYIAAVEQDFRSLKRKILAANGDRTIDIVILSGGASLMPWVQDTVRIVFEPQTIDLDNQASFVVAKGATLYAKKQMEALELLKQKIRKINFAQLYADADNKAIVAAIGALMPTMTRDLKNKNNVTGDVVRIDFCNFIQGLNAQNNDYCRLVKTALNTSLSSSIGSAIKDAIWEIFQFEADVTDVKIDIAANVINWDPGSFAQGGHFYNACTKMIRKFSGTLIFKWTKVRVNPEKDQIIDGVANVLKELESLAIHSQRALDQIAAGILESALIEAEKLFYERQLFTTTFAQSTCRIN